MHAPGLDPTESARRLLKVSSAASPQEIEAAYLGRIAELRVAFLDLGGFSQDPVHRGMRFESFVVGSSNTEAYEMARRVSASATPTCNPLFIYGSCGLGKTHLLNAIANAASARRRLVLLCSAASFTEEMIQCIARSRLAQFREKYRHLDYLVMDDVQMLGGRSRTQDETYFILNQLLANGARVVLAGRGNADSLSELGDGLRSRLSQAVAVEVRCPELAERQEILARKARDLELDLPRRILYFIAKQYTTDVRDLESSVRRIKQHLLDGGQVKTPHDVEALLLGTRGPRPARLTLEDVREVVAQHFNLTCRDVIDGCGSLKVKRARQIAIYLAKELCAATPEDLRRAFCVEPSQIAYAQKKVKSNLSDPMMSEDLRIITQTLCESR
ncbi:MAG: DnaA ATPase domain-containing protein [Candidatus Xenobia bacterium]